MKHLSHPNLLPLLDYQPDSGLLVFQRMACDLDSLLKRPDFCFEPLHVKYVMQQVLRGVAHMHACGFVHRDLKPENVLLNQNGQVVIGDFGLTLHSSAKSSMRFGGSVGTLCFQSPELLLAGQGTELSYSAEGDMWSVGCIFVLLVSKGTFLWGGTHEVLLQRMVNTLGPLTPERLPLASQEACDRPQPMAKGQRVQKLLPPADILWAALRQSSQGRKAMTVQALDLMLRLLEYNPDKRISAAEALQHSYFTAELPSPCSPSGMPDLPGEGPEAQD